MDTIELKLEQSKKTVVMKKYLTTGQSRELQRLLLSKGTFNATDSKFENIPPQVYLDMQDTALKFLVIEIRDVEGNSFPYTKEAIDELPIKDGNVVYEQTNKIIEESNLNEEARKK